MKKIIEFLISMLRSLVRWFVSKDEDKPTEPDNRAKRRREYNDYRKRKAIELRKYNHSWPRADRKTLAKTLAKEYFKTKTRER